MGEARDWPVGLAQRPKHAKAFYGAIAVATLLGAAANVLNLNPVKAKTYEAGFKLDWMGGRLSSTGEHPARPAGLRLPREYGRAG